jgi:alpha-mannosidase
VYEASGKATTNAALKVFATIRSAQTANLMEDSGDELKVQNNTLRFDLHPFEIKTFKLRLESKAKRVRPTPASGHSD